MMTLQDLPPLLGIGAVLTALVLWFSLLSWWQRRCSPHPELVRKAAHVGMGVVTLGFPWMFHETWPVWTLCAAALGVLAATRWWLPLRTRLGGVMGRVERGGGGEFYFALAVAAVFSATRGAPWTSGFNVLYTVPVLILTLADAAGALVGGKHGRTRYATGGGGVKSVEGSLAFFGAAFLSTSGPLLAGGALGWAECLLIGALLGLLATLLEAACGRGTDNLLVPLVSGAALPIYLRLTAAELAWQLAALAGLTAYMLAVQRQAHPDRRAPLAAALVLYGSWSLGGLVALG